MDTSQLNRPVYTLDDSDASVDPGMWPLSGYETPEGHALYFYAGDTPASGEGVSVAPAGDGIGGIWHAYTGAIQDIPAAPAASQDTAAPTTFAGGPASDGSPAPDPTTSAASDAASGSPSGDAPSTSTSASAPSSSGDASVPTAASGTSDAGTAPGSSTEPSGSTPSGTTPEPPHVEIDGAGNASAVTPGGPVPLASPAPGQQDALVPQTTQPGVVAPDPNVGNGGTATTGAGTRGAVTNWPQGIRILGVGMDDRDMTASEAFTTIKALASVESSIEEACDRAVSPEAIRGIVERTIEDWAAQL
jgi:hypothetical protein